MVDKARVDVRDFEANAPSVEVYTLLVFVEVVHCTLVRACSRSLNTQFIECESPLTRLTDVGEISAAEGCSG